MNRFTVPKDAEPCSGFSLLEIDVADKFQRNVGMNYKENSAFLGICKLGSEQIIACYGQLHEVGDYNNKFHFIAKCHGCKYALTDIERNKIFNFDPYKHSIFSCSYLRGKLADKMDFVKPKSFVYFISDGTYVKIGKADNVKKRLCGIQTGNPHKCSIVAVIPLKTKQFAEETEKWLHELYSEYRLEGEWFNILDKITCGVDYSDTNFPTHFYYQKFLEE